MDSLLKQRGIQVKPPLGTRSCRRIRIPKTPRTDLSHLDRLLERAQQLSDQGSIPDSDPPPLPEDSSEEEFELTPPSTPPIPEVF